MKNFRVQRKNFIDLSPMLDVIFQLVLFFLVTATFAVNRGIEVNLPQSESAENLQDASIEISVLRDGKIFFNGNEIQFGELKRNLLLAAEENPDENQRDVFLSCDKDVTAEKIVSLFDVLREAGFFSVSIKTKNPE